MLWYPTQPGVSTIYGQLWTHSNGARQTPNRYTYTAPAPLYAVNANASPSAAGAVTLTPPGGSYLAGTQLAIGAAVNSGWAFTGFPIELSHIEASGRFGIGDIGLGDGINLGVRLDADGNVTGSLGGRCLYGYRVPSSYLTGFRFRRPFTAIAINNHQIMVIGLFEADVGSRDLVFRKKDQTWRRVPLPAQRMMDPAAPPPMPPMRAFGHFIAIAEVQPKDAQNPKSAGRSEWRKGASKMCPDVAYLLKEYKDVYPGRLHLYDVDTGHTYTISTNQGDSEVLLVDNNTVYYRASDRLYSAPITESGIGPARLLATADAIRDAHWAFIKH